MVGEAKTVVGDSWKMRSGSKIIFSTPETSIEVPKTIFFSVFTRIDSGLS
jgi:hypothetical protein